MPLHSCGSDDPGRQAQAQACIWELLNSQGYYTLPVPDPLLTEAVTRCFCRLECLDPDQCAGYQYGEPYWWTGLAAVAAFLAVTAVAQGRQRYRRG